MKKIVVFTGILLLCACTRIAPIKAPLLSPFGDGTQWIVWQDIEFEAELENRTKLTIVVPRGFVTDLASTPREIWSVYPPFGKYLSASILHDYLYWRQVCQPLEADQIIYQAMRDFGVDQATQSQFYVALRNVGEKAWKENRDAKTSGLIRVIPEKSLRPDLLKPTTIWNTFRIELRDQGVKEQIFEDGDKIANACASLGKEIKIKSNISAVIFGK